jgi:hypothetical protein
MRDIAADAFLTEAVVDRRVDIVDAGVEHGAKNDLGLRLADVAGAWSAAQFHSAVTKHRHLEAGPYELTLR